MPLHPVTATAVTLAVDPVALPSSVFAAICAMFESAMPFVRLWNEYAPAPVRVRKPVLENPVMLSNAVPLAVAELVPPDDTASGWFVSVAVPCTVRLLYVGEG
ncbi:hypothetical protein C6Q17_34925 [Burkholderia contaminans]|nr:hypothetical protein C6Q17_34925 [Burkholderia contaminans]